MQEEDIDVASRVGNAGHGTLMPTSILNKSTPEWEAGDDYLRLLTCVIASKLAMDR